MSSSEKIKANMNTGSKIFGKHIRPVLVVQNGNVDMQNNGKERQKSVLHVQTCFLLIRKKVCCTCNLFFSLLIRSIDLDAIFIAVPFYGDVTRNDSQRRFLAQHNVAMLEQFVTIRNNVAKILHV